jgi:hypothetical protein
VDRATPSGAAEAAARARVADVLERLNRVDLQVVIVRPPDATRLAAERVALDAARAAGRARLFDEATAAARDATMRLFAQGGFSGTWAATDMAMSVTRADDRVAAATAFEEAAMAAVVEDLVDDDTLGVLRSTADGLTDMTGLPAPGSLSNFGASDSRVFRVAVVIVIVLLAIFGIVVGKGVR